MKVLHAGCGKEPIHPDFSGYEEIRLDINPKVKPDICGSILDIPLPENHVDFVYCAHMLEHVHEHEAYVGLREFYRVLKPGGTLILMVPDLQELGKMISEGNLDEEVYTSSVGPVTVSDILWGYSPLITLGNTFMAHKFGYTGNTLQKALSAVGFEGSILKHGHNLITYVQKQETSGGGT